MKHPKIASLSLTLILALLAALLTTGMAFASDDSEVTVTGTIVGIYPEESYLEIEVDNEGVLEIITVQVGQNFNFDSWVLGDLIEVSGTFTDDGTLIVSELKIQERARDQIKTQDGTLDSYYCTTEDQFQPVAFKAAETYGVDYSVIEGYLCGENPLPLGQILLALQTSALTGEDYTVYLNGFENISWGQIWQELGLQGKPDHGTAPGQIKQGEVPDETPGKGQGKGQGGAGQPEEEDELFLDWLPQSWLQKGKK
jgi:hypothetical protein